MGDLWYVSGEATSRAKNFENKVDLKVKKKIGIFLHVRLCACMYHLLVLCFNMYLLSVTI